MKEYVVKSFTIIDFLGYMCPGGVFLLSLQFFTHWVTVPYYAFFEKGSEATLATYFILASYLCGNFLHEIGAMIEPLFIRKNMHASYWEKSEVCDTYQKVFCFATPPVGQPYSGLPLTPEEQIKAGKTIFHYVQRNHRPQRLMLFHAFFVMGRTMFVTALLVALMNVVDFFLHQENVFRDVWIMLTCALCAVLSYFRWKGFEQKSVDEAYLLFVTKEAKASEQGVQE